MRKNLQKPEISPVPATGWHLSLWNERVFVGAGGDADAVVASVTRFQTAEESRFFCLGIFAFLKLGWFLMFIGLGFLDGFSRILFWKALEVTFLKTS